MVKCKTCTQALTKTTDKGCDFCAVHCTDDTCDATLHKATKEAVAAGKTVTCSRTRIWIMANLSPKGADWKCDCGKGVWDHPKGAAAPPPSDSSPSSNPAAPSPEAAKAATSAAAAATAAADGLDRVAEAIKEQARATAAANALSTAAAAGASAGAATTAYGAKDFRISVVEFRNHPADWKSRGEPLMDLLGRVCGVSTWDLRLERRLDERDAKGTGTGGRKGAAKASGAWNPDEDDSLRVLYDDCKLDKAGLSHMRTLRDAAGLVAVVAALSRSANAGAPITIPKASLRRGARGTVSAQLFLGELVTAFFVQLGLNEVELWFAELDEKHRADATFYVRFSSTKNRKYGMRWTQRSVRVWLGMYRAFLRSRPATFTIPHSHAVAMAPIIPVPVRDSKEEHDHTPFLFWLGVLVAVRTSEKNEDSSDSDEDDYEEDDSPAAPPHAAAAAGAAGAAAAGGGGGGGGSSSDFRPPVAKPAKVDVDATYDAMKASWTAWNLAFHKDIVMSAANVNEVKLLPKEVADAVRGKPRPGGAGEASGAGAGAGDGGGGGGGRSKRRQKRGGGGGRGSGLLGKDTKGDRRDAAAGGSDQPPPGYRSGPFKSCMWVDSAGDSCQKPPPPVVTKFGSRDPLCAMHRNAFNGLAEPDKATALANVKAKHPSITKLTRD